MALSAATMQRITTTARGVGRWTAALILLLLPLLFVGWGLVAFANKLGDANAEVQLPLLAIAGVVALVSILTFSAIAFSLFDLTDKAEALALPSGSVRAVIALSLILIFAIIVIFLFGSLSDRDPKTNAALDLTESAQDFAKQLLVMLGTLIAAVASFYFGTQSVRGSLGVVFGEPRLASVQPPTVQKNSQVQITVIGVNLQLVTTLRIADGTDIAVKDVTSNASTVKGTLEISATATAGPRTVIVETADGKTAILERGIQVQ